MMRFRNSLMVMICLAGVMVFATAAMADEAQAPSAAAGTIDVSPPELPYFAQAPDDPDHHDGDRMHGQFGEPGQRRKHLEELRMLKMLELLNLTTEQEIPFLTAFNQLRQDQRSIDQKGDVLLDSMATEMAQAKPSQARLKDLIARTKVLEKKRIERMNSFIDQMDTLLTTEQIAKLMIFQKRFEMELLEQIGRFRRGGMQGEPSEGPHDSGGF